MNVETGHLVENIDDVDEEDRGDYEPVPPELQEEARIKLAGGKEVHVQLDRRDSKLAKWARKRRRDKKRAKRKARIARESRRRNRRT